MIAVIGCQRCQMCTSTCCGSYCPTYYNSGAGAANIDNYIWVQSEQEPGLMIAKEPKPKEYWRSNIDRQFHGR
jgi:hypothetical protein